jgi:hypothetical protein
LKWWTAWSRQRHKPRRPTLVVHLQMLSACSEESAWPVISISEGKKAGRVRTATRSACYLGRKQRKLWNVAEITHGVRDYVGHVFHAGRSVGTSFAGHGVHPPFNGRNVRLLDKEIKSWDTKSWLGFDNFKHWLENGVFKCIPSLNTDQVFWPSKPYLMALMSPFHSPTVPCFHFSHLLSMMGPLAQSSAWFFKYFQRSPWLVFLFWRRRTRSVLVSFRGGRGGSGCRGSMSTRLRGTVRGLLLHHIAHALHVYGTHVRLF